MTLLDARTMPVPDAASPNCSDSATAEDQLVPCYGTGRRTMVRGAGCMLVDDAGRAYLDLLSGIGVTCLGHAHPAITDAVARQAGKLVHCSNLFVIEPQVALARWLCANTFADRVLFVNSGAEAIEAAIKMARRRAASRGEVYRRDIITFEGSFHGRTYGAMSATGQAKVRRGFEPLVPGMVHLPFGDIDALARAIGPETAAVLLEPVQGEGGVRPVSGEFLRAARRLCDEAGAALIVDEVQSGCGRTGTFLAVDAADVEPDIARLAKALGGGVPIGAVLATAECGDALSAGTHGTTYGGNPLVCAAALAVCETIARDALAERAATLGAQACRWLAAHLEDCPKVREVRGRGLMIGVHVDGDAQAVMKAAFDHGLIVGTAGTDVVRLLPPFIIEADELERGLTVLADIIRRLVA